MARKYVMIGFIICLLFVLVGCGNFGCGDASDLNGNYPPFSGFRFWDFLTYPVGGMMWVLGKIFGGHYILVIIFGTIIIRSIAWPIYAKSNDMSLKMSLIAPEQQKIEKRYEGKTDKDSMNRKNAEMMQLYKKYKINFLGCLTPIIQMPIFIAVFETLRRIPSSRMSYLTGYVEQHPDDLVDGVHRYASFIDGTEKITLDFDFLKSNFLGIDLFKDKGDFNENKVQFIGIIVIAVLVGITQVLSQILSQRRQKKQQAKNYDNVPEYRRPTKTDQQGQTELMLKIMLYAMPVMMVYFIIVSPAALGIYWLIGNLYTTFQSFIGAKQSEKRLKKLKEQMEKY